MSRACGLAIDENLIADATFVGQIENASVVLYLLAVGAKLDIRQQPHDILVDLDGLALRDDVGAVKAARNLLKT